MPTPQIRRASLLGLLLTLLAPPLAADPGDGRLQTMRSELARSQAELRLDGYERPYHMAYQVWDIEEHRLEASVGALRVDERGRRSVLDVDVRVGDYALDSSEDPDVELEILERYQPDASAPLDPLPAALRRALWLQTDVRYKQALLAYNRIRGKRVFDALDPERAGSFSKAPAVRVREEVAPLAFPLEEWSERVRRLSLRLAAQPHVFDSAVRVGAAGVTRRLVTTDPTDLRSHDRYFSVTVAAVGRAEDGMLLDHSAEFYWRRPEQAPDEAALEALVDRVVGELAALIEAPVLEPYFGPAILAPRAAGVFFHEALGHRLEGQRQKDDEEGQTFRGQVGKPVLPDFIDVVDDPTREMWEDVPLNGSFRHDEEGVAAQPAVLVDDGVLRGFLLSRRPVEGFDQSNGHGRAAPGRHPVARMGNLVVSARGGESDAVLEDRLREVARQKGKPFGLRIGSISGGSTNTSAYGYQAFKGVPRMVYKIDTETGEEHLVRGVEFVGTPLTALASIVAAGHRAEVFNGYCGAESGWVPVSAVAPAMLFEEIELQRSHRPKEKGQLLPPPPVDVKSGEHRR